MYPIRMFSTATSDIRIVSNPWENPEGLFGQVFLWVFEILPYLYEKRIFPDWRIQAAHYGQVIPGALDLAYEVLPSPKREIHLARLHSHRRRVLGHWPAGNNEDHAADAPRRQVDQRAVKRRP